MESRSSPSKVGADRAVTCWYSWVGWGWPGCSACWPNRPPAEDEQINKVRLRLVKNTYICWRRMNGMRICVWGGEREALRSSLGLSEGAQKFYSSFSHKNLPKLGACVWFLHWLHIETWLSASCDHQWWQWINAKIWINWGGKRQMWWLIFRSQNTFMILWWMTENKIKATCVFHMFLCSHLVAAELAGY